MIRHLSLLCVAALVVLPCGRLAAQETATPPARKQIRAVRVQGNSPRIDGRLDEEAWQRAPVLTDFVQRDPTEGAAPTERTEIRFVYDGGALYVGARMYSRDPATIQAPVSRRDNGSQAEQLQVSLDTYLDRRTAYTFGVTAAGVRLDWYNPIDDAEERDHSFDAVWEAGTRIDSLGWTAEMRIPFSQLRFRPDADQVWGLNVNRWIPSKREDLYWVLIPKNVTAWASRFGELVGIAGIRPTRRVELSPYVATGADLSTDVDPEDPFHDGSELTARIGGDLKMGIGPNLTLDATVNPDFGQVELDPAEVNLSAFETFFPERRPFFTEGLDLLEGGGAGYFYSRRIGASPRGGAPGDFVDAPSNTTILGAAKLTGRVASGLSVGGLAALTARERARFFDAETGTFGTVEVEPVTAYGVGRVQRQFGSAASTAGLILTGVRRDLAAGSPLAELLNREAYTGGADWNLRFRGGEYALRGNFGFSHVAGDSLAILRAQRSSARYFQRPDADYVTLDSSRTSLSGYAGGLGISRLSGRHWLWDASVDVRSPGFELNDIGRLGTGDEIFGFARLRYRETRPGPLFRGYSLSAQTENEWNFGGIWNFGTLRGDASLTWRNYWVSNHTVWYDFPALSDNLSRGGPLVGMGGGWVTINSLANAASSPTRWRVRLYYGENELGDPTYRISGGASIRPGPRWQLSADPNYVRFSFARQFIGVRRDGPEATFGEHYLFSRLEQRTFLVDLRLNYAFRPDLTLELYAQPFAASGRFYQFGQLPAARSRELRIFGTEGTRIEQQSDGTYIVTDGASSFAIPFRDFNVRSFRSNTVLRWEWRRGSTLFVVWQQDRSALERQSAPVGITSLAETFGATGDNLFLLKATYWIGR